MKHKVEGVTVDDRFLGLDIASATGWASLQGDEFTSGEVQLTPGRKLTELRELLIALIETWRPTIVFVEDIFINPRPSTKPLLHMHGVMLLVMETCNSPMIYVPQSRAKSYAGRNGKMSSAEKKGGAMVRALAARGYHVDGTEEADALAIALTGRYDLIGACM